MSGDRARRLDVMVVAVVVVLGTVSCESIIGPSRVSGSWTPHESARFTLYARPDSFGEQNAVRLAELLEDQYTFTVETLGISYSGRVSGFLYSSAAEADRQFDRSGTAYPETEAFKIVCVPPLDADLFGLMAHEANHVILWNGLGRAGTRFLGEGLPSAVISEHAYPSGPTFLHAWAARNMSRIPALETLADDSKFADLPEEVSYRASASFLAYLIDTYGPRPLKQMHGVTSHNFARRFTEVYGRPLADVEADWRRLIVR